MFHKKFSPALNAALASHGFESPLDFQREFFSKCSSGGDFIFEADDNAGKTTAILIYLIWKLQRPGEDAPRAIVMVEGKEDALAMQELFIRLSYGTGLRSTVAYEEGKLDIQRENIYVGVDLVIGTPKRIQEIYFQNGINVNKLKFFVLDDGELLMRKGYQGALHRFWQSLPKSQHILLTDMLSPRLLALADEFMRNPEIIEL